MITPEEIRANNMARYGVPYRPTMRSGCQMCGELDKDYSKWKAPACDECWEAEMDDTPIDEDELMRQIWGNE